MAAFADGTPCWIDAALPDLRAGLRFYGELFGWTFEPPAEGGGGAGFGPWTQALSGGRRVAGLAAKEDGRMPTTWGVHFATTDIVALVGRAVRHGGQVVRPPARIAGHGLSALVADPAGAVFGAWQPLDDGGFEKQGEPGTFCWTEVYTRDPERVDPFYEAVLGVRGTELPGLPGEDVPYLIWSPAGTEPGEESAVAGRSVMTAALPAELPGHFLNYFAVEDCDETAARVVRLGGRVTAEPFDIPYGRMAVLADDQGAAFGILAEPTEPTRPMPMVETPQDVPEGDDPA